MKYYVYILYSQKRQKYYVGQTNNVISRLLRHNNGYVKSTKSGLPWKLLLTINVESSRSNEIRKKD